MGLTPEEIKQVRELLVRRDRFWSTIAVILAAIVIIGSFLAFSSMIHMAIVQERANPTFNW